MPPRRNRTHDRACVRPPSRCRYLSGRETRVAEVAPGPLSRQPRVAGDVPGHYKNLAGVGGLGRRLPKKTDGYERRDRFLHESSYAPQRALAAAVVMLLASIVVLLLPSRWEIMGGQLGLVCSLVLALTALVRYRRQRSSV